MSRLQICLVAALLFPAATGGAEPRVGGSLAVSEDHDGGVGRVSTSIYVLGEQRGGLSLGGELAGGLGGYLGGWGCDTVEMKPGAVVPSIATTCLQPSVGLHGLAGYRAGATTAVRLEVGLGAMAIATLPGAGGRDTLALHPSGVVRAAVIRAAGAWAVGLQVSQQVYGVLTPRSLASVGLVLEAASD